MLRLQAGDKLGLETASFLGVEITDFFRNINEAGDGLVVALLGAFLSGAAGAADLNRELLAARVTDKLAGLFLHITRGTRGLVDSLANISALSIAHLNKRPVALLDLLLNSLLLEGDLASLLKVLFTNFLLSRGELRHIGVMTLLHVLVRALQDGVFLQSLDNFFLLNAAKASFGVGDTVAEVNGGALDIGLSALSGDNVGGGESSQGKDKEDLRE